MTTKAATNDVPPRRILTDPEWQNVAKSLARVGVNADAVEYLFESDLKGSLRDALPIIFERSDVNGPKDATARTAANNQTGTIKRCNDLIAWLDNPHNYNRQIQRLCVGYKMRIEQSTGVAAEPRIGEMQFGGYQSPQFLKLDSLARTAQHHLIALVAELEHCRDELMTVGTSRGQHLRKTHIVFWEELTRIFDACVSNDVKFRNQHKINFLRACSEPYCPEEATDSALSAFVERRSERSTSSK